MKKKHIIAILLALFCALGTAAYFFFESMVIDRTFELARVKLKNLAVKALDDAGDKAVLKCGGSSDFMVIEKNSEGNISLVTSNSKLLNDVASLTLKYAQENIGNMASSVTIPLGAALGSTFFSESGPKITVNIYMQGYLSTNFNTEIKAVGINQTWYRLYMDISADLRMSLGRKSRTESVENPYLLSECIILGKVPGSFYSGKMFSPD